jgi:pimeloyl-ACP methyl ester carboxylesterase
MTNPADIAATTVRTRLGPLHVQTAGSGPPAVLWHSLFVDSTTWMRVLPALAAERRLVLIDGPAHGRNPPAPRRFTLDDCAGAAADAITSASANRWTGWATPGEATSASCSPPPAQTAAAP